MKVQGKKIWFSLLALTALVASAILAVAMGPLSGAFAKSPGMSISDFSIRSNHADAWGTAFDKNGNVWVATPGCDPNPVCSGTGPGGISAYNPKTGSWTVHNLPSSFAQALFLAFDKQGRLWFPLPMNDSLGMYDPATNKYSQWSVPTQGSGPWDVAVGTDGKIWFTEHLIDQIGYFDPATKTFKEFSTPTADSQPYGITVDASNNVWFAENNASVAQIGEYTSKGKLLEYKISNGSTAGLTPHLITTDSIGDVWWSEGWVGRIGKLKIASASAGTTQGVSEFAYNPICGSCGTHTSGIAVDHSGNAWFDDSLQGAVGSFNIASSSFSVHNAPTSTSHPHDGMNADANGIIWFTEQFANKLGRVN